VHSFGVEICLVDAERLDENWGGEFGIGFLDENVCD